MTTDELKQEAEDNKPPYAFCALNTNCELWKDGFQKGAETREKRIAELEQENAELDCQKNRNKFCYSCANATEKCFKNEIGCPCDKYKSYKDENAELKKEIRLLKTDISILREGFENE